MAALLVLGPALVAALGPWRFLAVYLAAGVAGNLIGSWIAWGSIEW